MTAAPARRPRREEPPPAPGTVEVRLHGRPGEVDIAYREIAARLGEGRLWWYRRYSDHKTGMVRVYAKVTLPPPAEG